MPLTVIKGQYRIIGAAPDGDSVRFYPNQLDAFNRAGVRGVRVNRGGGAQLRLDAIDALETHYTPASAGSASCTSRPASATRPPRTCWSCWASRA